MKEIVEYLLHGSAAPYLFTFFFIVVDFISGYVKGISVEGVSSSKMRAGLYHKLALFLIMLIGIGVDKAQEIMDLGFSVPAGISVCVYITTMEISSSLENICIINPEVMPDRILSIFGKRGE